MTPKEKAIELVSKFEDNLMECDTYFLNEAKKRCVLISVDEIITLLPSIYVTDDEELHNGHRQYWEEVKQEIEKL